MKSRSASELLLGVDAGTTLAKVAVYGLDGACLGSGEARQGVTSHQPGWAEQQPADWWRGARRAVRQALQRAGVAGDRVAAIGISTQGGTLAVFDERGRALGAALVWSDARQRAREVDEAACEEQFALTGLAHLNMSPAALVWLRDNRSEWFAGRYRIGYVPDYLVFRLTGEWASDATNLGICNLSSLSTGDIALPVIERVGLPRDSFAVTRQAGEVAGTLNAKAAKELGLRQGIPVAVPGHDQYCAALGAGCVEEGDLLLSTGTAWVLLLTTAHPITDRSSSFWPGRHVQPGRWGLMGAISSGGGALEALLELTRQRADWERINAAVEAIPAGSDGLLVIPHLVGRTLPSWNSEARGAILGWSLGHRREHLWRAAMEGLAMETRVGCEYLAARGADTRRLRMVGGAARSPVWPRILASVLGNPIHVCAGESVAVRGAACLAARALGAPDLPQTLQWEEHRPVREWQEHYERAFARYREALRRLED
jgi:xylulokinase